MSTERDSNRDWLLGRGQFEDRVLGDWARGLVEKFGVEGALDWLAATSGGTWDVDLRRKLWASRPWLKDLLRAVRDAESELTRALYRVGHDPWGEPAL